MQVFSYILTGVFTFFFLDFIGYNEIFHVYSVFTVIAFILALKMDSKEDSNFND